MKLSFLVATLAITSTPVAALSVSERKELYDQVEFMCRYASNIGEVLTYEGNLSAGAVIRFVGGELSGRVDRTSWENLNQVFGDYRNDPTICRMKILDQLAPLFGESSGTSTAASIASHASKDASSAGSATPTGAFSAFAGPTGASAASATHGGTSTSHSD